MEGHFPPLFVPLVPVYIAPPYPPTSWQQGEQQQSEQDTEALTEIGSVVGSSVDTEARNEHPPWDDGTYAQLRYVYDEAATWFEFEEGLWIRASPLPLLDHCYIEFDDGRYRSFGTRADFWRMTEFLNNFGIVVVNVQSTAVHILRKGKEAERMALKPGLRYLRCFPDYVGVLMLGDDGQRSFGYLEAAWRRDSRKEGRPCVQTELVMAALKGRDCCHVCFW